jgi:hypothetical protein
MLMSALGKEADHLVGVRKLADMIGGQLQVVAADGKL